MTNYLDIKKSVMISSPAGSGKTEKLARRYIALLQSGVDIERILAITFTDKAAAEMKQRILRILKDEDEKLFHELLQKIPLMRVSTIHSFCSTLIRRFSFEISIDPNYTIEDTIDSRITWESILYEILMEADSDTEEVEFLLQALSERGFRGLAHLKDIIDTLFNKLPFTLEAEIPKPSFPADLQALKRELIKWPGASESISGYGEIFESGDFYRLITAENHFLTLNKDPRRKAPGPLKGIVDYKSWSLKMFQYWMGRNIEEYTVKTGGILDIFRKCIRRYSLKKSLSGNLDFSDLEHLAFKLLTENPDWANVLYAFDEKTDHILVDEFQDTNTFQWSIIDQLTEEWRAGIGAKREEGTRPTLFLVGDEKQSIYFFRGANVGIFHDAREKLQSWLREEFSYEEVRENYRSLPAIIDFTNVVFSAIMNTDQGTPPWMTRYSPFQACREDIQSPGKVELILIDENEEKTTELKKREAIIIAKRIQTLVGNFQISERIPLNSGEESWMHNRDLSQMRLCRYMDIALLLRRRTHLKIYEETFRQYGVPFVVVKGIGFYQEPEVALLRAIVYFLANPKDDYNLYVLLKSPFFSVDEGLIIQALSGEGRNLFEKLKSLSNTDEIITRLERWLSESSHTPVAELIEKILTQTKAWKYFYEEQRKANIKKFIQLLEGLESSGKSLIKIKDFLERTYSKTDEPKANVNTEGMDAVRIMTIHGSKGLEFPLVFIPGIDETIGTKSDNCLIYEEQGRLFVKYSPESAVRRHDRDFFLQSMKEEEEQKRLFYVSATRAEEGLFLVGQWRDQNRGFLGLLRQSLGLERGKDGYTTTADGSEKLKNFSILSDKEAESLYKKKPIPKERESFRPLPEFIPIVQEKEHDLKTVTEVVDIKRRHGREWLVTGDVMHRIFEEISKRVIGENKIRARSERLLSGKKVPREEREKILTVIIEDISLLKEKGIWQDVIMPRGNAFSELPFILDADETIYTGRIDRVIIENNIYKVYDYKTFPVQDDEIAYLLRGYTSQLDIYKQAVKELFQPEGVKSYIVFTHRGEIREIS
ncbi:MAG: UvrD-helicase domain-containing protein [Nitrospiraceae bacterium]|nr:MAG: UvrD-helicase domain-containing protein [Nitrospiraceae bacterium]